MHLHNAHINGFVYSPLVSRRFIEQTIEFIEYTNNSLKFHQCLPHANHRNKLKWSI